MPNRTKTLSVSVMIHEASNSSATRIGMPSVSPRLRAFAYCSSGNLLARMDMKMTLSTPSTISCASYVTAFLRFVEKRRPNPRFIVPRGSHRLSRASPWSWRRPPLLFRGSR